MRTLIPFLVFIISIQSCADKPGTIKQLNSTKQEKPVDITKPPGSFSDTLIIRVSAAVFYSPDSLQLVKLKAITSPREFETDTHNSFYQMRNARMVLKKNWPGLKIVETSHARYLLFKKADQQQVLIDLNNQGDMWGIYLFDRKKDPELADMMNIDTFLGFYFQH